MENTEYQVIKRILLTFTFIILFSFLWVKSHILSNFLSLYTTLFIFVAGFILLIIGNFFLKEKYTIKRYKNKAIISTHILADFIKYLGILSIAFSFASLFLKSIDVDLNEADDYVFKILMIFLQVLLSFIFFTIISGLSQRLKYSINDKIIIDLDLISYDNPLNNENNIFLKKEIIEIIHLKEFLSNDNQFSEDSFSLNIFIFIRENDEKIKSFELLTDAMNVDQKLLVKILTEFSYIIIQKSKYQDDDIYWEGHNFKDGYLFKKKENKTEISS